MKVGYLFERIKPSENDLILEIGVGTGKNIPYYGEGRYVAVDISEKMIFKARERIRSFTKDVQLIIGDAESLPFKDEVFDIRFLLGGESVRGLKEAYRVLKPDGRAFFLEHMLPKNRR